MEKTFTPRALRKHVANIAAQIGGEQALADSLGIPVSDVSKFVCGHCLTYSRLFRGLGLRFDVHRGTYVQDDEQIAVVTINDGLAWENQRLRRLIKSLNIRLGQHGLETEAA